MNLLVRNLTINAVNETRRRIVSNEKHFENNNVVDYIFSQLPLKKTVLLVGIGQQHPKHGKISMYP
jgi:hypothetical protein